MELTYTLCIETTGWPNDPNLDPEQVEQAIHRALEKAIDDLSQDLLIDSEVSYTLTPQPALTRAGERYG